MKNFVLISPHFPESYYQFALALKNCGFRVLGIGDAPYDELKSELKWALTEYYRCYNMDDFNQEIEAVRFFEEKYGHIDYLESNNEYWLSRDAKLREMFGINTGLYPEQLADLQHKSSMKKYYRKAGVGVAKDFIVTDLESTKKFIEEVGYPVFVKPDIGVGAETSYKIKNEEELLAFFKDKNHEVPYLMEQLLTGRIVSFDGMADSNSDVVFATSNVFPPSVSDVKNLGLDFFYYTNKEVPAKLMEIGKKTIKAFGLQKRFFHAEFFELDKDINGVGKKGDYAGLEVNLRTPGGYTPDMINFANSVNCYQIYADVMDHNTTEVNMGYEKYFCACASRRDSESYFYSDADIYRTFNRELCNIGRYPDVFSGIMGNTFYMAKFKTLEEVEIFHRYVNQKNPDHEEYKNFSRRKEKEPGNICDTHMDGA